jgi:hypothetical protein
MRRELLSVMAVDPGGWTGVQSVIVPLVDGVLRYSAVESLDRARALAMTHGAEIKDDKWQEHVNLLVRAVQQQRRWVRGKCAEIGYDGWKQVLIVEGFIGGEGALAGDVFSPVRISACLQWILEDVVDLFVAPLPAEKGQITDARLKLWGWHTPGAVHLNDARRHLFVYLRSLGVSST